MTKEFLPEKDKDIALEHIIFNLLILALERDIQAIKNSQLKLKEQHVMYKKLISPPRFKKKAPFLE